MLDSTAVAWTGSIHTSNDGAESLSGLYFACWAVGVAAESFKEAGSGHRLEGRDDVKGTLGGAGVAAGVTHGRPGSGWWVTWIGSGGAMGKGKPNIPDRWTDYLPLGKRIPGTRFIAFKVPLKKSFEWKLAPNERFSPLDLIHQVREQKEELGLIIDLTYTTRYYEPEELPGELQYCKIFTVGHEVPDTETVLKFKSVVEQFLTENQHNDKLIGVHCTHGLNRTGYLICRYLIDEGMDPNLAIEVFNRCRGHSIERKNYIDALIRGPDHRNHHAAVSGYGWMNKEYCRYEPDYGFQEAGYSPQHLQQCALQEQRHILPGRGRVRQNPYRRSIQNQNLIPCYDNDRSVYSPWHPSAPHNIQQRWDHNRRSNSQQFDSSYQPYLQECGPSFPVQNPYLPHHGRYSVDRQFNQNFY